jgi:hypothetical protein
MTITACRVDFPKEQTGYKLLKEWWRMKVKRLMGVFLSLAVLTTMFTIPLTAKAAGDFTISAGGEMTAYTGSSTAVVSPSGVTSIGDGVFEYCSELGNVAFPASGTTIGEFAFIGCQDITSADLSGVTSIGIYAFNNCGLTGVVTIPGTVTSIGAAVFASNKKITAFSVSGGTSYVNDPSGVLFNSGKTTLMAYPASGAATYTIPGSVTSIDEEAFDECPLTSVTPGRC